ncbi:hypothetical protein ScPMuIL_010318 [Solemya velum]
MEPADVDSSHSPVTVKSEPIDIDIAKTIAAQPVPRINNLDLVLSASPARRESKCYETKYEAIKVVELGTKSKTQVAKEFKVPVSTLATWVKNSSEIKEKYLSGEVGPQRKKSRGSKFPEVEQRLLKWFSYAQEQNIALSGEIIRRKARTIAAELNISQSEFECSSGWLERFKLRHGITFKRRPTLGKSTVTAVDQRPKHDKIETASLAQTVCEESSDDISVPSSSEAFFIELNDETEQMLESATLNEHSEESDESDFVIQRQAIKRRLDSKSYKTKYEAIREVEMCSKAKTQIAKDYKIPMSTLSTWIKKSEEIKAKYLSGQVGPQRKKSRGSKFPKVERELLNWYTTVQKKNFPISGEMMRVKARSIATNLNIPESDGTKRTLDSKPYQTKYDALCEVENGIKSKKQIAKEFKVPTSTLSTWIKKSCEIKKKYLSGRVLPQRKNSRGAKYPEVEQAVFDWFTNALQQNVQISGEIIREKARYFASELQIPESEFDCSVGWLDRFKARHGIVFRRLGPGYLGGDGKRSAICHTNTEDEYEDYAQLSFETTEVSSTAMLESESEDREDDIEWTSTQTGSTSSPSEGECSVDLARAEDKILALKQKLSEQKILAERKNGI